MSQALLLLNVDDNEPARYLKTKTLTRVGYRVIEAGRGEDALRLVAEQRPDLILLDVNLPDISGLEVCRRLKSDFATRAIPIVQISATHVTDHDRDRGFENGADIYLTEPVEPLELTTVVDTLLRLRESETRWYASEQRFKAVINQATAGIVQTDLQGRYLLVNQRYSEMTGRSADDLGKTNIFSILHPDDRLGFSGLFARMVSEGSSFEVEKRVLRPDGRTVWMINSISLVRDGAGHPEGAIAIAVDITSRRRAEDTARLLADLTEQLAELTDQETVLQKTAATLVPVAADWCVLGLHTGDSGTEHRVHAGDDSFRLELPVLANALLVPSAAKADLNIFSRDESHLARLAAAPLRSIMYLPLTVRDVKVGGMLLATARSDRTYDEQDLVAGMELARRIAIALENTGLYFALQDAARRKDEFLAMLAHELRNPLAPLRNVLHIMEDSEDKTPPVHLRRMMERQVGQMTRLVDDLLDVSRINTGKIDLRVERVALAGLLERALEVTAPGIRAAHTLDVTLPPADICINGDAARIEQVVINLLDNARKYTPPGGHIRMDWAWREDKLAVTVSDDGIGIEPAMLMRVFNMFAQADQSLDKSRGGLGIGLTLVKQLMELHGGRVEARSAGLGLGSRFTLIFPTLPASAAGAEPVPAVSTAARAPKRTVLVVDDNLDSAESLGMMFTLMGHEVRTAHDGELGLEAALTHQPDVIFLDIGLPGLDGYEVARRIRVANIRQPLLVALSGYGATQDRRRATLAGFDAHIVKPADPAELEALLARGPAA